MQTDININLILWSFMFSVDIVRVPFIPSEHGKEEAERKTMMEVEAPKSETPIVYARAQHTERIISPVPKRPYHPFKQMERELELGCSERIERDRARCLIAFSNAFLNSQKKRVFNLYKTLLTYFPTVDLLFCQMNAHAENKVQYMHNMILHLQKTSLRPDGKLAKLHKDVIIIEELYESYCKCIENLKLPANPNATPFAKAGDDVEKAGELKKILATHPYLKTIRRLDLSNQKLRVLPEELIFFTKLKTLTLYGNSISSLPEALKFMPNLTTLEL